MSRFFSPEQVAFLKENFKKHPISVLTEEFNKAFSTCKTREQIRKKCSKMGMSSYPNYTSEQVDFLRNNFDKSTFDELAIQFNERFNQKRTANALMQFCEKHGMVKKMTYTKEQLDFIDNNGKMDRIELCKKFNEKFGTNLSHWSILWLCKRQEVRREFLYKTHGSKGEVYSTYGGIRILEKKRIYEEHFGKVEKDEVVLCLDGNEDNLSPDNLVKIKRRERFLMLEFDLAASRETTLAAVAIAKLRHKIIQLSQKT